MAVPALKVSEFNVTSDGQVIERAVEVPVNCTVTVKLQLSPVDAVHVTAVFPTGKVEPEGGLQTTSLLPSPLEPQLPAVVGDPYVTIAVHWLVLTGDTLGQVTEQVVDPDTTRVEAEPELSGWRSSFVSLVTVTVLVIFVPSGVPAFMLKANEKIAVSLAGRLAMTQLIAPVPPGDGVVQVNEGPDSCVSETKVVPPGTAPVITTFCAASGPRLIN